MAGRAPPPDTDEERARILAVAGARPDAQGVPLTRWSLPALSRYLKGQGIAVSPAHLGRILAAAGLAFLRTRSWQASPDPDFERKAARVLALYAERPKGGVVISFDEGGPWSLRPHPGRGWARPGRPERQRATYTRRAGVRHLFGAYDVHADYLRGRLRPRKNAREVLAFLKTIRAAYPSRLRLYWIQDNLSCHWTKEIRDYAAANNVELVATPTYASYLNRIENHCFNPIAEFVLKNADYLDWDAFGHALAAHIRYRNSPEARLQRRIDADKRRQRQAGRLTASLKLAA